MQSKILYQRLMGYVFPYWKMGLLMLLATAVYASTNALFVKTMQPMIDEGFVEQSMSAIYMAVVTLFLITLIRGVGFFVSSYASRWISSQIVLDIRNEMFAQLQVLPHRYFDKTNTGETLSRFNYDVLQVTGAAMNAAVTIVRESITIITLLSFLFYQNWLLTLSILVMAPVVGAIILVVSKRLRRLAKSIQTDMGEMNHILDENIKGQKIVKIYAGQPQESTRFKRAVRHIRNASIKSEVVTAATTPVVEVIITVVLSFVIIVMAYEAREGELSAGQFVTYIGMMAMLFSPIKKLTRINEYIQKGLAASESIFTFIDEKTENKGAIESEIETSSTFSFSGELSFHHVNFSYDDELVLDDFNLTIKAGETIALVGASGSGKSSLVALIPRFYDINAGEIKLDGINIADMDLGLLRQQISFVNQDTVLFNTSVGHNIAYGVPTDKINSELVREAANSAFATGFINKMEAGFNSVIGEAGQRLSGGQKQRLSIARAIYKNAPIFILDEATSALDTESEQQVQQALDKLIKGRTSIIIAHRLSTIRHADRIIVLDKGKIIEQGSHQELLAKQGQYYQLQQLGRFN